MDSDQTGLDDEFMATMLSDFLDESQGYLSRLNDHLLVLDELLQACDSDEGAKADVALLNEMFRDAHSMKGLSAMLQLGDINSLTHKLENILDAARNDQLAVNRDVVDVVLAGVDRLGAMVEALKVPGMDAVEAHDVEQAIHDLLAQSGVAKDIVAAEDVVAAIDAASRNVDALQAEQPVLAHDEAAFDPLAGVVDEADLSARYLAIFLDEADESLDALSDALTGDAPQTDPLLVICHKLKGGAAAIGLNRAAKLAHAMEDLLQELRDRGETPNPTTIDTLLVGSDALRAHVRALHEGKKPPEHLDGLAEAAAVVSASRPTNGGVIANDVAANADSFYCADHGELLAQVRAAAPVGAIGFVGVAIFESGLPLSELKARLVCNRAAALGELFYCDPSEEQLDKLTEVTTLAFGVATACGLEELRAQVEVEGARLAAHDVLGESVNADAPPAEPVANEPTAPAAADNESQSNAGEEAVRPASPVNGDAGDAKNKPAETLRVEIDRLDHLMNLTGQLVINKARFTQISERFKGVVGRKNAAASLASALSLLEKLAPPGDDPAEQPVQGLPVEAMRSHVEQIRRDLETVQTDLGQLASARTLMNELGDAVHQLERVADGLQKSVMDTRMVPIGPLFGRFKRVVRDITRGNGKDVQLVVKGDKTELDKRMIDELGDPLIHMVRNSVDHGVESPADRTAAGKPPRGTITLEACHRGNRIAIQVSDDGRGLDPEKLKAKAVSKGILAQADADRMSPQQALQLIWEPGFSTAEKITEISGRGMGMDIVRSKIDGLNGSVELDSQLGVGTTITITLPLTMAILPSLMTVVGGDVFAMPMESVIEIVSVRGGDLATAHGQRVARVRDRVVAVAELGELLAWSEPRRSQGRPAGDVTLVIIGADGRELAVPVDDLLGEEDVVIKSLAENYRHVVGIAGASILGNGRVSLILDVPALLSSVHRNAPPDPPHAGGRHGLERSANSNGSRHVSGADMNGSPARPDVALAT